MIYNNHLDIILDDIYIPVNDIANNFDIFLKLEGFSIGNSIKIKPALKMITRLEVEGKLKKGKTVIESSSGNLGIALSIVCAAKGYPFICVIDPNIQKSTEKIITAYGSKIIKVEKKDNNGGYLSTRIKKIINMCNEDNNLVWLNQYENIDNIESHYQTTAHSIHKHFPKLDYLFIGAGTTGTLCGVGQYIKKHSPKTNIIAVDSIGSVTFKGESKPRYIPGLGSSKEPPISQLAIYDKLVRIEEIDTINMCQKLAKQGLLVGGSTGTVMAAINKVENELRPNSKILAISPDFGERYIDTIYNPSWINKIFNYNGI